MDEHTKTQVVDRFDKDKLDGKHPLAAIAAIKEAYDKIPKEYQEYAEINIDTEYSYGDTFAEVSMVFSRPENDTEKGLRLANAKRTEDYQRQQYERLKAQFEGKGNG